MKLHHYLAALAVPACAVFASAQQTLLFVSDETLPTLGPIGALRAVGEFNDDEVAMVTPTAGAYSASPFLSVSTQWAFIGDIDGDGDFVESGSIAPGGGTNAVFVHPLQVPPAEYGPRDVYVSKEATTGMDTTNFEDGDVFRYSDQGSLEFFVRETQILDAIGQAASGSVDVDAICMDFFGNLFLSFDATETVNGISAADASIIYIDSTNITYDPDLNVQSFVPGSAVIAASEADVAAMILASNVKNLSGGVPSTTSIIDLTGLELDFNFGTWTSPQDAALVLPNLMFSWDANDAAGAILSTAGGGSIATVNGIAMGGTSVTYGDHLGLLPDEIEGIMGLGLIPQRAPLLQLENWPLHSYGVTSPLFAEQEIAGATPGGVVAFFVDLPVAGNFPAVAVPGFSGEIYGALLVLSVGTQVANANGVARNTLTFPPATLGSGLVLIWEALDVSTLTFAWPGVTDF